MQGVAAVEICSTSEMNKDKLQKLTKAGVPWIEIKAEHGYDPKISIDEITQEKRLVLEVSHLFTFIII